MSLPHSVAETAALLAAGGYVADPSLCTTVFLALSMQRPLFLEGEPGTDLPGDDEGQDVAHGVDEEQHEGEHRHGQESGGENLAQQIEMQRFHVVRLSG